MHGNLCYINNDNNFSSSVGSWQDHYISKKKSSRLYKLMAEVGLTLQY